MKTKTWVVYRTDRDFDFIIRDEWNFEVKNIPGVKEVSSFQSWHDADSFVTSLRQIVDQGLDIYDPKTERVVSNVKIPEEE